MRRLLLLALGAVLLAVLVDRTGLLSFGSPGQPAAGLAAPRPVGDPEDAADFDHGYAAYAKVLRTYLRNGLVDYGALTASRRDLDEAVRQIAAVPAPTEAGWSREERLAYWINAYNLLTLRLIVDHYPIQGSFFSLHPRNSIRQIDGAWDEITWSAAGRRVTLDQIEHEILRPRFEEPRIHFAINCASMSCPPLAPEPYRPGTLDTQLDTAARRFLASPLGLKVDGHILEVSSIFDWYGEDFIAQYASLAPAGPADPKTRAILGAVIRFGPPEAAALAGGGGAEVEFLSYDWSLNTTPSS